MRLTVHVANAQQQEVEVPVKEKPGSFMKVKKTFNTLSFPDIRPQDVDRILAQIESDGLGIPMKHYLSGEKIKGRARGKKKA